jgi:signal transduction histidine kinase
MPVSRAAFIRTTILYLLGGIAVLVVIVSASLWLTLQSRAYFERVVAAREVRNRAADLLSLVQDAETGQRGYLLTADPTFLAPYEKARTEFDARLAALDRAMPPDSEIRPDFEALRDTLRQKMQELAATVELTQGGKHDQALALLREGHGRQLMDDARARFGKILSLAEFDLARRSDSQSSATYALLWVTSAGAVIILLMAGAGAWTILQYTRELMKARTELESLNAELEDRVEQRTQALHKANAEIQRFAYIVTHDLRAPLVNIMGFTSELEATFRPIGDYMMAEGPARDALEAEALQALKEDVPEAIGFIRSSTRKMDGLINAILKISREGSRTLRPERVDLRAALENAAAAVRHQSSQDGGGIAVEAEVPALVTDRLSLDQVLGNLLDNAVKYRATDRPIRIDLRARRLRGGLVAIEVADNGRGIAPADHERIFELFRRSGSQNTPGEGIGLAHVRTLVRNLGGDITVASVPGRGSTFTITLPPDLRAIKRSDLP